MIHFENPLAFFLLLLIPAFYFLRAVHIFSSPSIPLTLGDWNGSAFEYKQTLRTFFSFLAHFFSVIGFTLLVVAYTNPTISHQEKIYVSKGSDILYVLDVSPSMAARDMSDLTRLEAAKSAIKALETKHNGSAAGIIEMGKDAKVLVPCTMDRALFFEKLDNLVVGDMGDGTAIGTGLLCALFHLKSSRAPKKNIVLITDGENNSGIVHPHTAAALLKENNINLYILGIGTRGRVPVEYIDPATKRLYTGTLESDYDTMALFQIAAEANGTFFETNSLSSLSETLETVNKTASTIQSYSIKNSDKPLYRTFLCFTLMFFIASFLLKRFFLKETL